ncbi:MAG: (2Fe-2S)-binding protein [Oscillospiraceae bacterium]|nr:(2Fe-2S)-binding protein [Oscillospiraceae bacterium]
MNTRKFHRTKEYIDTVICNCNQVRYSDIEKALHEGTDLRQIEEEFRYIQEVTKASTGCGGCHDKVLQVISELLSY